MGARIHIELRDFREFYREHLGFVWHALYRLGTAADLVEDAVQDVFVVAYRRRGSYGGASPKAWLYGISRRVASNYRRGRQRLEQRRRAMGRVPAPSQQRGAHEAILTLDRYLEALKPDDRELFILSELEGMSGPEIAQARGRNVQTIYTRLRKLRDGLADDGEACQRVRESRPRASAGSWAALVPLLGGGKPASIGWLASLTSGWALAGIGVASAVSATVLIVHPFAEGAPATPPALVQSETTAGTPGVPSARASSMATRGSGAVADPDTAGTTVPSAASAAPHGAPSTAPALGARSAPAAIVDTSATAARPQPARSAAERPAETGAASSGSAPASRPVVADARAAPEAKQRPLAASNALLRQAAEYLSAGAAEAAQATLAQHARRFGDDAMSDLRSTLRIEALCLEGKPRQALGEAAIFLRHHATSPFAERVETICRTPS